ncbi:MAG TPA: sigma-70 family RNA polymerase sigma factor [Terriglobales bacterium]|nr:sigma-70 family RNA polymerase sigma factor [Terriglobales bacterium]
MRPKKPWFPGKALASPQPEEALAGASGPRLSGGARVNRGVSTAALQPGMLAAATGAGERDTDAVPLAGLSDAQVMLRVKAGDDAAFDYLVSKFRRAMVSFMYRMAHNQAVAEELAQEVFLRVYRSRSTYAADAKFTTWLYRIATNLAVNYSRDTRPERAGAQSLDQPDPETGLLPDPADGQPTVEQEMVRQERLAAIRRKVQALPERQRLAVVMHKYQELDYREIGQILKLSESATKSLLFRAYETLREELKEFVK